MKIPTIVEFVKEILGLALSAAQECLLRAIYGLPLTAEHRALFRQCTGRERYEPGHPFSEVTVIAGARAGKDSRIACPLIVYEAIFGGYEGQLSAGERGTFPLVAQDQKGTSTAFGYIRDYIVASPLLRQMVAEERAAEIRLTNRMVIQCFACSAKSMRSYSIPAAVMDEVAFFRSEAGTVVDEEVQTSIKRGGIQFPHQRLVKISTPHAKSGVLWNDFKRYWGQDNPDVLVWVAPTTLMNPAITADRLAREFRADAKKAGREYEALFLDDVEAFLPGPWIDGAIAHGRQHELPPLSPRPYYVAAVDPSGGSRDSFALALCHVEGDRIVQDLIRAWAPSRTEKVNLALVCQEIAAILKPYGVGTVTGDHYAGQWVAQEFQQAGLGYDNWGRDKSAAYLELEPFLAQGRVDVIDDEAQVRELRMLEKHLRVGGKPVRVDHPKGAHDDKANALALCVAKLAPTLSPAVDVSVVPVVAPTVRPGLRLGQGDQADDLPTGRAPFWGDRGRARFWGRGVVAA